MHNSKLGYYKKFANYLYHMIGSRNLQIARNPNIAHKNQYSNEPYFEDLKLSSFHEFQGNICNLRK